MNSTRKFVYLAIAVWSAIAAAPSAHGATMSLPVENWGVQVQSAPASTVTNNANSPTFTPADQVLTVMGRFRSTELEDDGDYVHLKTTLTLVRPPTSSNLGPNALNTQLRIGLFDGPDVAVAPGQINTGIFIVYANNVMAQDVNRRMRFQTGGTNPFAGTNDIGNSGSLDPGGDTLQGQNVGPVDFELKLTRNNDAIDIFGRISGTNSADGDPYVSDYAHIGFIPAGVGFKFDRAGFFFGNNVDGTSATLSRVRVITNVPEPTSLLLAASSVLGGVLMARRRQRAA